MGLKQLFFVVETTFFDGEKTDLLDNDMYFANTIFPMHPEAQQNIQVLIIEDDTLTAESMCFSLQEFGFVIKGVANSVESALHFLNRENVDIVLVDIYLNGTKSGIEIGTLLTNLYRLPFIFITGMSDKNIITEAVKAQPAAYLLKPANPAELFACIQTALQNFSNKQTAVFTKQQEADFFFVKQRNKLKRIEWKEVVTITSADNYTVLTLLDKSEHYLRSTLAMTLKFQVPLHLQDHFMQVNRGEVVQIKFITEIIDDELITPVKKIIITKSFVKEVKLKLNILS